MKRGIADFFGVGEESPQDKVQWQRRRQRLHTKSRASRGKVHISYEKGSRPPCHNPQVTGSRPGGYGTLSTELLTDYHNSIIK